MIIATSDQQRKAVRNKIPLLLILFLFDKIADLLFLFKNILLLSIILSIEINYYILGIIKNNQFPNYKYYKVSNDQLVGHFFLDWRSAYSFVRSNKVSK